MAWSGVPFVWSIVYRIPVAIYRSHVVVPTRINVKETLLSFFAHGGCALIVVFFALQLLFFALVFFVASCTLAEAQRFSTEKGVANVAMTLFGPVLVIAAAV